VLLSKNRSVPIALGVRSIQLDFCLRYVIVQNQYPLNQTILLAKTTINRLDTQINTHTHIHINIHEQHHSQNTKKQTEDKKIIFRNNN
jgi:hypothetical protein